MYCCLLRRQSSQKQQTQGLVQIDVGCTSPRTPVACGLWLFRDSDRDGGGPKLLRGSQEQVVGLGFYGWTDRFTTALLISSMKLSIALQSDVKSGRHMDSGKNPCPEGSLPRQGHTRDCKGFY